MGSKRKLSRWNLAETMNDLNVPYPWEKKRES
jgi:hypothetical protein